MPRRTAYSAAAPQWCSTLRASHGSARSLSWHRLARHPRSATWAGEVEALATPDAAALDDDRSRCLRVRSAPARGGDAGAFSSMTPLPAGRNRGSASACSSGSLSLVSVVPGRAGAISTCCATPPPGTDEDHAAAGCATQVNLRALWSCEKRDCRACERSQQSCQWLTVGGQLAHPKRAPTIALELRRHRRPSARSVHGFERSGWGRFSSRRR
jgi:hypothetical protein